jgi:hypothetical protein
MSKHKVTVLFQVKAVILAENEKAAQEQLFERIETTQCWQAWGEPTGLDEDDLVEWEWVYPKRVDRKG